MRDEIKEQLLEANVQFTKSDTPAGLRIIDYGDAENMLEEYAKQTAIAFAKWCSWTYLLGSDGKTWIPRFTDQRKQEDWKTTEQLFELFNQSI